MTTIIKPKRSTVPSSIPTAGVLEIGELAINIPDGKLYTKNIDGTIKELGGAGATTLQAVTNSGAVTTNNITLNGANIIFEGYIENAFETTLSVEEPTGDREVKLPDRSGVVAVIENGSDLVFEGSINDNFETTLSVVNPTADRTITLPNQNGMVAMDGDALAYSIVFGS